MAPRTLVDIFGISGNTPKPDLLLVKDGSWRPVSGGVHGSRPASLRFAGGTRVGPGDRVALPRTGRNGHTSTSR
jgi:hypothetical protein